MYINIFDSLTRTKKSIRYAKENEREREREREVKGIESKIFAKSPKPRNEAQRKVDYKNYDAITMSRNYQEKL